LIELLKPTSFLRINSPRFIWAGACLLLLGTIVCLVQLFWIIFRESRLHQHIVARLREVRDANPLIAGDGLNPAAFDLVEQLFEASGRLQQAWRGFQRQVLVVRNLSGEDRIYSSDSADNAFNESAVIDARLNRNFYSSFPGLVTGVGLLLTFIAILFALHDIHFTLEKKITGVDTLVEGLLGKFVSSVAALFAASLFLLLEKSLFHKIENSRRKLVAAIDAVVPRRTTNGILSDLHRSRHRRTVGSISFL
jgi:hypothetical protein